MFQLIESHPYSVKCNILSTVLKMAEIVQTLNGRMKPKYFDRPEITIRLGSDLLKRGSEDPHYSLVVDYYRKLAVLHHKTRFTLVFDATSEEIFRTESTASIEDCFAKMYQISPEQIKKEESGIGFDPRSKVTCHFVLPQLLKNMSQHQLKHQTVRVVAINGKFLEIGYLFDTVLALLAPVMYENFSFFVNIESELGLVELYEVGLLYKCCELVIKACNKEMRSFWQLASDEELERQFVNYAALQKSRKKEVESKKTMEDFDEVNRELLWAIKFVEGEYAWVIHHNASRELTGKSKVT